MSNLEKIIAEIDQEIKYKSRKSKPTRKDLVLYGVHSLKMKLLADDKLLDDDEIIRFYEHYFKGNYGFKISKGWIRTKDRLINLNHISNIKISSEDSKHFCDIVGILTTQVRIRQGDEFMFVNESVKLTDFVVQDCMANYLLDLIHKNI